MSAGKHSNDQGDCREAVLLMDFQPRLLSSIENSAKLVDSVSILSQVSRSLAIPLLFTEQVPDKLGKTLPNLTSGLENPMIIEKHSFSAFGSPAFRQVIHDLKINKLVLAGIETPICIFLTAMDAIRSNMDVSIIYDCIGCRNKKDGERSLNQLLQNGAEIIPLETFLFGNLKSSTHPNFKELSSLIKSRN